jgi:two-component system sensor histidine kinase BarA
VITQRLVKEMGGDISFHSQPNRGSTFWFHINLDLNPNAIPDTLNTAGWRQTSGLCGPTRRRRSVHLEMLAATPLEVIYSPTFSSLAEAQYDICWSVSRFQCAICRRIGKISQSLRDVR